MQLTAYGRLSFVAAIMKTPMYFVALCLLWRTLCISRASAKEQCVLPPGVYVFTTERDYYMRRAKRAAQGMQLHYRAQRYSAERSEAQRERSDHYSILLAVAEGEPLRIEKMRATASIPKQAKRAVKIHLDEVFLLIQY